MTKYMVLYNSATPIGKILVNTPPSKLKSEMREWIKWNEEASRVAIFDIASLLQAVNKVTPDEVTDCVSEISGFFIIEAESKDTVLELLKKHPHLKQNGNAIYLLEMLPIPKM